MSKNLENLEIEQKGDVALVTRNGIEPPIVAFLDETLSSLSENQKSLLNSQAANRELLGVIIQDNFNLKEENSRLRERILELERSIAKISRQETEQRDALRKEFEAKINEIQKTATEAMVAAKSVEAPEIKTVNTKPGCLGSLLGIGHTQVITVPRSRRSDGQPTAGSSSVATPAGGSPNSARYSSHPKPTFPPE